MKFGKNLVRKVKICFTDEELNSLPEGSIIASIEGEEGFLYQVMQKTFWGWLAPGFEKIYTVEEFSDLDDGEGWYVLYTPEESSEFIAL